MGAIKLRHVLIGGVLFFIIFGSITFFIEDLASTYSRSVPDRYSDIFDNATMNSENYIGVIEDTSETVEENEDINEDADSNSITLDPGQANAVKGLGFSLIPKVRGTLDAFYRTLPFPTVLTYGLTVILVIILFMTFLSFIRGGDF